MQLPRAVVVVVAVVVTALLFGNIIASGHAAATLDADLDVIGQTCSDGAVTELTLRVGYEQAPMTTVTAHVWSSRQHVQFTWDRPDVRLFDGDQNITITAPDERAYIEGDRAQVYLATGQQRAIENFEVRLCN
jgi:hypothetical protein